MSQFFLPERNFFICRGWCHIQLTAYKLTSSGIHSVTRPAYGKYRTCLVTFRFEKRALDEDSSSDEPLSNFRKRVIKKKELIF